MKKFAYFAATRLLRNYPLIFPKTKISIKPLGNIIMILYSHFHHNFPKKQKNSNILLENHKIRNILSMRSKIMLWRKLNIKTSFVQQTNCLACLMRCGHILSNSFIEITDPIQVGNYERNRTRFMLSFTHQNKKVPSIRLFVHFNISADQKS